jgi:Cu+-exporting ATPase
METNSIQNCTHCGLECPDNSIFIDDKLFCCSGCKTVFELLNENNLSSYYGMEMDPAQRNKGKEKFDKKYEFLDDEDIQLKILTFKSDKISKFTVDLPDIHCSACLYLLENISKIDSSILESRVNFLQKKVFITFENINGSIRKISELLDKIGYPPKFTLSSGVETKHSDRSIFFKLGAAFFAFGNIMLFAFPEYISTNGLDSDFRSFLSKISLILTPVILYAGWDYFKSAFAGIKAKYINIDVPIAIGMAVLVLRSTYEILTETGVGYLDSLSGLVFFLLVGKIFQKRTYDRLKFDRELASYFPLSVLKRGSPDKHIPLMKLEVGDTISIKNEEIIPADSILMSESATIDFSFVTGESESVPLKKGDRIWAGGINKGKAIEMDVVKIFDESTFTNFWNKGENSLPQNVYSELADKVAKYFTYIIIILATASFIYWYGTSPEIAFDALTAVLIIACPCALALTTPFTYGSASRVLSRQGLFLKDSNLIEKLANIKNIVFDKTGTLTNKNASDFDFIGEISVQQKGLASALAAESAHPVSRIIVLNWEKGGATPNEIEEVTGKGIIGVFNGEIVKIGSAKWLGISGELNGTFLEINGQIIGRFIIKEKLRDGVEEMLSKLSEFSLHLISGDSKVKKAEYEKVFNKKLY